MAKLRQVSARLAEVLPCFVASQRQSRTCPDNPLQHEIETLFVEGHTDSLPMFKPGGNRQLSFERALTTADSLIAGTRLEAFRNREGQPIFSYSAYAETRPRPGMAPDDGRNRRVDLRIVLSYRPPEEIRKLMNTLAAPRSGGRAPITVE